MTDSTPLQLDEQGHFLCPLCGDLYVHIDDTQIGGRPREDGPWRHVQVDDTGTVSHPLPGKMAMPTQHGEMRRHFINLLGWCENCGGRFAIHFVQHKGTTDVYASRV